MEPRRGGEGIESVACAHLDGVSVPAPWMQVALDAPDLSPGCTGPEPALATALGSH
jgi:hypothetical protein